MPRRRTYASRGFSTRGSRRGAARRRIATGVAALLAILGLTAGGALFARERLLQPTSPAAQLRQAAINPTTTTASVANAQARTDPAQATRQMGGATQDSHQAAATTPPAALSTPLTALRQWDATAEGIAVDMPLVGQLDQALAGVDGTVSVAVKDLASGRGAVLDGNREMEAASLFKLLVLYSVFEAQLPMSAQMVISEQMRAYDLGTLELGVGETLSVAEALERMVTISDNTSAIMLGSRVGAARITRNVAAIGMESTHYSLDRMTTSALDMLRLLELVGRGDAVSESASSEMVHLMLRQRVNDRLPRLLPDGVRVAHKTGNLPGVVNDVGLVYGQYSTVAVAALVSDTTNEAGAATAIARVALAAHAYFDDHPSPVEPAAIPPQPARAIPPVWRQPRPPPPPTPTPRPVVVIVEPTEVPVATPMLAPPPTLAPTAVPPTAVPPTPPPTQPAPTATRPPAPTATPVPPRPPTAAPTGPPAPAATAPAKPKP